MSSIFKNDGINTSYGEMVDQFGGLGFSDDAKARLTAIANRIARFEQVIIESGPTQFQDPQEYPYDKESLKREFLDEVFAEMIRLLYKGHSSGLIPNSQNNFDLQNFNNSTFLQKRTFLEQVQGNLQSEWEAKVNAAWAPPGAYLTFSDTSRLVSWSNLNQTNPSIKQKVEWLRDNVNSDTYKGRSNNLGNFFTAFDAYENAEAFDGNFALNLPSFRDLFIEYSQLIDSVFAEGEKLKQVNFNAQSITAISPRELAIESGGVSQTILYSHVVTARVGTSTATYLVPAGTNLSNFKEIGGVLVLENPSSIANLVEVDPVTLLPTGASENVVPISNAWVSVASMQPITPMNYQVGGSTVTYDYSITVNLSGQRRTFLIPHPPTPLDIADYMKKVENGSINLYDPSVHSNFLEVNESTLQPSGSSVETTIVGTTIQFATISPMEGEVTATTPLQPAVTYKVLNPDGTASDESYGAIVTIIVRGTPKTFLLASSEDSTTFAQRVQDGVIDLADQGSKLLEVEQTSSGGSWSPVGMISTAAAASGLTAGQHFLSPMEYLLYWNDARVNVLKAQLGYREAIVSEIQEDLRQANAALAELEKVAGSTRSQSSEGEPDPESKGETLDLDIWESIASSKDKTLFDGSGGDDLHVYSEWQKNRTSLKNYVDRKSSEAQQAMLDYQTMLNRYNNAFEVMGKIQEKLQNLISSQYRNML